jgi:hypothetical protein
LASWFRPRKTLLTKPREAKVITEGATDLMPDKLDAGKRFIEAWKRARIIVDTGGGHSGTPTWPMG